MKKLLLNVIVTLFAFNSFSTHIVGGEFHINHINNDEYDLYLFIYFDQVNGNPAAWDQEVIVSLFEQVTNIKNRNDTLGLVSENNIDAYNQDCFNTDVGISVGVYHKRISLNNSELNSSNGYYYVWDRCCKTDRIDNLNQSGDISSVFYLDIPSLNNNQINSSPVFYVPYNAYAVVDSLFEYNFGAVDNDGDILTYGITTPLTGFSDPNSPIIEPQPKPFNYATWDTGYSFNNYIPSSNPVFTIDSLTGVLRIKPTQVGLYNFMILCKEYRDGNQIGEVNREYQLVVGSIGNCLVTNDNVSLNSQFYATNTGFFENENKKYIKIYSDKLLVHEDVNKSKITLFDSKGVKQDFRILNSNQINMGQFKTGIYFLSYYVNGNLLSNRFIVSR